MSDFYGLVGVVIDRIGAYFTCPNCGRRVRIKARWPGLSRQALCLGCRVLYVYTGVGDILPHQHVDDARGWEGEVGIRADGIVP